MGCVASGRAGCAWGPSVHPMPPDIEAREAWGEPLSPNHPLQLAPRATGQPLEVEVSSHQAGRGSLSSCHLSAVGIQCPRGTY